MSSLKGFQIETIPLLRGREVVTSLLGSFGHGLRETRLTASLGYLVAKEPDSFRRLLKLRGAIRSVTVEHNHDDKRADVRVETTQGVTVVEAKTSQTNPRMQALGYRANHRILVTPYHPTTRERALKKFTFVTWSHIAEVLRSFQKRSASAAKTVSADMLNYLEEHRMIKAKEPVEIYAREINEPHSLQMFLQAAIYGCFYQRNSRLAEAQYFAPHFGRSIQLEYPGVQQGISYVARIENVEPFENWGDFRRVVISHRGRAWFKKHAGIFDQVKWLKKPGERLVMLLSQPQLVFNPPVRKEKLQTGSGWLSKRFFTFEELFKAWGK